MRARRNNYYYSSTIVKNLEIDSENDPLEIAGQRFAFFLIILFIVSLVVAYILKVIGLAVIDSAVYWVAAFFASIWGSFKAVPSEREQ